MKPTRTTSKTITWSLDSALGNDPGQQTSGFAFAFNVKRSNTTKIRDALFAAKNGTARKRGGIIGDSTTAAVGSNPSNGDLNASWSLSAVNRLKTRLTAVGYPTKTNTFLGGTTTATLSSYTTYDGRVTSSVWSLSAIATNSIGGKLFQSSVANDQMNFTPGGSIVENAEIAYLEPASGRSILIRANSATIATLSPDPVTPVANKPRLATVNGITTTTTLGFRPGAAGAIFIIGAGTYQNGETAMTLYQGGWPGSIAGDWNDTSRNYSAVNAIPALALDWLGIELTINDENASTNLTTYKAHIQALIDAQKATGGDVFLIVGGPSAPNPPAGTHTSLAVQMTYWQALYDLATLNDIPLLDLTIALGSYDTVNNAGLMYDISHLTASGYSLKGDRYYDFFSQIIALGA